MLILLAGLAGCSSGPSAETQAGLDRLERELKANPAVVSLRTDYYRQTLQGESTGVDIVLADGTTSNEIYDVVTETLALHADLDRPDSALGVNFTFNADPEGSRLSYSVLNRKSPILIEPFRSDTDVWLDTVERYANIGMTVRGDADRYRRDVTIFNPGGPADLSAVFRDLQSRWDIGSVAGDWATCLSAAGDQPCRNGSRLTSYDHPPTAELLELVDSLSRPPAPVELTALNIVANPPDTPPTKLTAYLTVPELAGLTPSQAVAQAPVAGVPAVVANLQGLICASSLPLALEVNLVPNAQYSTLTTAPC